MFYTFNCPFFVMLCIWLCRLYEFKDILESEVIDIEKLRKLTFRGRFFCCQLFSYTLYSLSVLMSDKTL